jgi:hypothetical protein
MKFTFPPETRVLDGYTIKRAIYRGGFGEVYYALSDAGREVALKLLQNNTEIELRGVQQCLNLSHPNLITIFDVRQDGEGDHWIIMEYIAGETLDAAIRNHPEGMPMEVVLRWLPGIAGGVGFLHSRGLVHRDLKPANIFSDDGTVKVGDVGLSKFITPSRRSAQTQSVGTVYYMAPEVARGRYGKEVDVYALGIILYEMLTGRVPFEGESTGEILMKHLSQPPDLTKLPQRIRPVIGKSLEKDPAKRFLNVEAFARAFENAVVGRSEPLDIPDEAFIRPVADRRPSPGARAALLDSACGAAAGDAPISRRFFPTTNGWWWIVACVVMFLFVGGTLRASFPEMLFAGLAIGYASYIIPRLRRAAWREWPFVCPDLKAEVPTGPLPHRTVEPAPRSAKPFLAAQAAARVAGSRPTGNRNGLAARRLGQWFGAAALSAPIIAALTAGIALVAPSLLDPAGGLAPGAMAMFASTALVATWLVTFAVKATESPRNPEEDQDTGLRRLALVAAGVLAGVAAWGIGEFLYAPLAGVFAGQDMDGLVSTIGERPLLAERGSVTSPTLLGYIVFFAGLFGLRSWWKLGDLSRDRRFSAGSVLLTVLIGLLWSGVVSFPQTWGVLWAAIVSATVQIASPVTSIAKLRRSEG